MKRFVLVGLMLLLIGFAAGYGGVRFFAPVPRVEKAKKASSAHGQIAEADLSDVIATQHAYIEELSAYVDGTEPLDEDDEIELFLKNPRAWSEWTRQHRPELFEYKQEAHKAGRDKMQEIITQDLAFLEGLPTAQLSTLARHNHNYYIDLLKKEADLEIQGMSLDLDESELKEIAQSLADVGLALCQHAWVERESLVSCVLEEYRAGVQVTPEEATEVMNRIYELTHGVERLKGLEPPHIKAFKRYLQERGQ